MKNLLTSSLFKSSKYYVTSGLLFCLVLSTKAQVTSITGEREIQIQAPPQSIYYRPGAQNDTGVSFRVLSNPPSGQPIFQVRSSGQATRLFVEHDGYTGGHNSAYFSGITNKPHFFGNSNVYITNNLGIGTTTPAYKLDVAGAINATEFLLNGSPLTAGSGLWTSTGTNINYNTGNVGIGTATPSVKLHVQGDGFYNGNISLHGAVGKGIRFWNNDLYKIHMGNGAEYNYGPVGDYAIKMNMSNHTSRGWTWGVAGQTPIAALNTQGNMKVAGSIDASSFIINGTPLKEGLWAANGSNAYYDTGNVGIGTNTPLHKLDVAGTINATQLMVNGTPLEEVNFGQINNHNTYNDFNTPVSDWGWNFVQGNTNGPNSNSSQWYRFTGSLGSEYPIEGSRGFRLELAFPRFNQAASGVWMRTMERGVLKEWVQIGGASSLWSTSGSNAYFNTGSVGIGTNNPAYQLDVAGTINATRILINGMPLAGSPSLWSINGSNVYYNSGNVGIGTSNAEQKLDLSGPYENVAVRGRDYQGVGVQFSTTDASDNKWSLGKIVGLVGTPNPILDVDTYRPGGLAFHTKSIDSPRDGVFGELMERMRIDQEGDVSIGTTYRSGYKLNVNGSINATDLLINGISISSRSGLWAASGSNIYFNTGKVAIGTTNMPALSNNDGNPYSLYVGGGIYTEEVKVQTGWADYVLKNTYKLPSLDEEEQHIKKKGHLIGFPSEAELKAQGGLELGSITKQQQVKIEELMLHVIAISKELKAFKKENIELIEENIALKKQVLKSNK